jgi:hypothetical protein
VWSVIVRIKPIIPMYLAEDTAHGEDARNDHPVVQLRRYAFQGAIHTRNGATHETSKVNVDIAPVPKRGETNFQHLMASTFRMA